MGTNVHSLRSSAESGETIAQSSLRSLSEATLSRLRSALAEQLKLANGPTPELISLLKHVGAEAREKNIRPEQLIVAFKSMLNSLDESHGPREIEKHERVRQTLVTLCIQAYYAE
jgi:hypothetical protein